MVVISTLKIVTLGGKLMPLVTSAYTESWDIVVMTIEPNWRLFCETESYLWLITALSLNANSGYAGLWYAALYRGDI